MVYGRLLVSPPNHPWQFTNSTITVYTCQKPQPTRCGLFLWDDEARSSTTTVLLGNSRSEPGPTPPTPPTPITPTKAREEGLLLASPTINVGTPTFPAPSSGLFASNSSKTLSNHSPDQLSDNENDEFYDWPVSEDEAISKAADHFAVDNPMPPPETPRKAVKPDPFSTPAKRRYDEMLKEEMQPWPSPSASGKENDIFTTPSKSAWGVNLFGARSGLPSPMDTPTTPYRFRDVSSQEPELAKEILETLQNHHIVLAPEVQNSIKNIGSKHSLFTHGVMKGRDVSRSSLTKKNERIAELQGEIAALHAERETDKAAIRELRGMIETMREQTQRNEDG